MRQRLSEPERERRLEEAVQRFMQDVIALGYAPEELQARLQREFLALVPRKTA